MFDISEAVIIKFLKYHVSSKIFIKVLVVLLYINHEIVILFLLLTAPEQFFAEAHGYNHMGQHNK